MSVLLRNVASILARREYGGSRTASRYGACATMTSAVQRPDHKGSREHQNKPGRKIRWLPDDDKTLAHFLPDYFSKTSMSAVRRKRPNAALSVEAASSPLSFDNTQLGRGRRVYIETRGCQMNVSDSEIVRAVLHDAGYDVAGDQDNADCVLINTCAIRDKAEEKVWQWLRERRAVDRRRGLRRRVYALLGCMAERLKTSVLEHPDRLVDIVVGPDAYRDLPLLLSAVIGGESGAVGYNVQLSVDETYSDITPLRENVEQRSAFVSIARSCPMSCSFCIVPFVRGPERSRSLSSIMREFEQLVNQGVKEITLLGQNVNSWRYYNSNDDDAASPIPLSTGFHMPGRTPQASLRFTDLLDSVSRVDPEVRVRFTSPHPAHFPEDLLHLMAERGNICSSIHLPAQSGSAAVLSRMRRRYTADAYKKLAFKIRKTIPGVSLSTDIIAGFCGETESEHQETLQLLREVQFEHGFFFAYSERAKTEAARTMVDDVPNSVKQRRLREIIDLAYDISREKNQSEVGTTQLVLVEHGNTRAPVNWGNAFSARTGRTDSNKRVVFPDKPVPNLRGVLSKESDRQQRAHVQTGDYLAVRVTDATSRTLFCEPVGLTTLRDYMQFREGQSPGTRECC